MKSSQIQRHPIASNKLLAALVAFSGSAALLAPVAYAQATWTGTADQDWNNAANWSTSPSNPTGAFTLNLATGNYPILGANSAFSPNNVLLGDGASQTGRFDHRAGSLSQAVVGTNGNWFHVGINGGTGTYNLADTSGIGGTLTGFAQGTGSLTVGKLWVGGVSGGAAGTGTVNINTSGTINAQSTSTYSNHGGVSIIVGTSGGSGTLNLDNGTVNAAGVVDVGSAFGATQATQGTLNISGGVFNSEGDFRTAFAGSSRALATVNLSGGTLNVASGTKRWMILGRFDSAKSVVNVSGGNLNLNTNTDIRFAQGGTGTHVINLNSGAITSYSGNQTGLGAGVVDLMQGNVAANNTFNLNGGTLTVRQVISNFSNGTRTFNFNTGDPNNTCAPGPTCVTWDPIYLTPEGRAQLLAQAGPGGGRELRFIDNKLKVPYSDQFSLGVRGRLTPLFEVEVGYSHIESKDGFAYLLGNRRPDGTFFPPAPAAPNSPFGFAPPGFGSIIIGTNGLETSADSGYLKLNKNYTVASPWSLGVTYTYTEAEENRQFGEVFSLDYPSLEDYPVVRSSGVRKHRIVASGSVDLPIGVTLSGKFQMMSPPYLKTFVNTGGANPSRDVISNQADSNGDRWGFRQMDIAITKYIPFKFLSDEARLRLRVDIINLFNDRNYVDYNNNPASPEYLSISGIGVGGNPPRTIKVSAGFQF